MDAPLGRAVGNALEVIECIEVLKGGGPPDLVDVSVELAARMLVLGKVADDIADAEAQVRARDRVRRRASSASADHRASRAAIRGSSTTTAGCRTAPDRHADRAPTRRLPDAARRRAGRPRLGRARRRPRPRRGSGRSRRRHHGRSPSRATQVQAGDPVLELHYRDRAQARRGASRWRPRADHHRRRSAPPAAAPRSSDEVR